MKSPVWFASYPKSGNTWMRLLFAVYQMSPNDEKFELSDAYQATMSESRRQAFERIAGKTDLTNQENDEFREAVQIELSNRVRPPNTFTIGQDVVPTIVYVEGVETGSATLTWTLRNPQGQSVATDAVLFTVVYGNLQAHRQQSPVESCPPETINSYPSSSFM